MDCKAFTEYLADIVAGSCPAAVMEEAAAHADGCSRCGELLRAWQRAEERAEEPAGGGVQELEFTRSVVARTSGSSCCAARNRLPDYVDGTAGPIGNELLEGHLAGCAACRAIAETLSELAVELPSFLDLDPGPGFAGAVSRSTARLAVGRRPSMGARFEAWWGRLLDRPRIGFELAYVGTLLLVLVFGNPAATLQAASAKTYALAETGLSQARSALPSIIPSMDGASGSRRARVEKVRALGDAVSQRRQGLEQRLLAAWQQAWAEYASAVSEVQRLAGWVRDRITAWWANITTGGSATEPSGQSGRYTRQERPNGA